MKGRAAPDTLARDLAQLLKPLLAPAAEKAELLTGHLAARHRLALTTTPKGLSDAARRLRAAGLTDAQIRAGAKRLMAELEAEYGRESVV